MSWQRNKTCYFYDIHYVKNSSVQVICKLNDKLLCISPETGQSNFHCMQFRTIKTVLQSNTVSLNLKKIILVMVLMLQIKLTDCRSSKMLAMQLTMTSVLPQICTTLSVDCGQHCEYTLMLAPVSCIRDTFVTHVYTLNVAQDTGSLHSKPPCNCSTHL